MFGFTLFVGVVACCVWTWYLPGCRSIGLDFSYVGPTHCRWCKSSTLVLFWILSNCLLFFINNQVHYNTARSIQKTLQDFKSLQDIIAILGMDELSKEDQVKQKKIIFFLKKKLILFSFSQRISFIVLVKSRNFFRNHLPLPKYLLAWKAKLSLSRYNIKIKFFFSINRTLLLVSKLFWKANTIRTMKLRFSWLAASTRYFYFLKLKN